MTESAREPGVFFMLLVALLLLAPAALQADVSDKPLRVALTGKYPPFSFYGEDGELTGFDVQVARRIGSHLEREVEIVTTEWDGILAGLLLGSYDAIIGSMAITPERSARVDFSSPYYVSGAQLFVQRENRDELVGIEALEGKRVGVGLGETYEHYLRNTHPEIEVVSYKATTDIFQDMRNRRIEGFLVDRLVGLYQVRSAGFDFVPAGPLLYREEIGIPVRPDRPDLLADINQALAVMEEQGELDEIRESWFGSEATAGSSQASMATDVIAWKLTRGFGVTLLVAALSIAIGLVIAIPVGVLLNRRGGILYYTLRSIDDFIRATPLLIQLFFVYFGAPQIGIKLEPIQAAVVALGINAAAYMAEVVRAGLMAVPSGQHLAGRALGLTPLQVFRLVVWPQALRVSLPPMMNSIVALAKDTALISVIAVGEVIREAQSIISVTYNPLKYYFIVAAMFFVVTFPLMKLADRLEHRMAARGFSA